MYSVLQAYSIVDLTGDEVLNDGDIVGLLVPPAGELTAINGPGAPATCNYYNDNNTCTCYAIIIIMMKNQLQHIPSFPGIFVRLLLDYYLQIKEKN